MRERVEETTVVVGAQEVCDLPVPLDVLVGGLKLGDFLQSGGGVVHFEGK
jgi:hypothetical protein